MDSEELVANKLRIAFGPYGPLWRNNSGVLNDKTGRPVRYGLANESAQQNKKVKSSDLIGITTMVVQPHHVGMTVGLFTAFETKPEGWHLIPSDERAHAQAAFHRIVRMHGGIAGFVTCVDDMYKIFKGEI